MIRRARRRAASATHDRPDEGLSVDREADLAYEDDQVSRAVAVSDPVQVADGPDGSDTEIEAASMANERGGDNPPWKRKHLTCPNLVDSMAVARRRAVQASMIVIPSW
jgi:hypothetical protein